MFAFFIGLLIVGAFIYWLYTVEPHYDSFDIGFSIFMGIILDAMIVFMISCIAIGFCPEKTTHYSFKINAIQDNITTVGYGSIGVFYSRINIDGEMRYYFARNSTHGEKVGYIPANKTYIKEYEGYPKIEVHQSYREIPNWMQGLFSLEPREVEQTEYYIIYVPEETVINEYTIDLQ